MQNELCGCSGAGQPNSYSLRLLCDMVYRAEERKRKATMRGEIQSYLSTQTIPDDERGELVGILETLRS
jgi:hypothetical protein